MLDGERLNDIPGSFSKGVETIAHLRQPGNGRLTIMFIALDGGPRIVRLFGTGKVIERATPEFEKASPRNCTSRMGAEAD